MSITETMLAPVVSLEETDPEGCPGFDQEAAECIVSKVSSGIGWSSACEDAGVDSDVAWKWRALNVNGFRFRLEVAEKVRLDRMLEDLIEDIEAMPVNLPRVPAHIKVKMDFLKTFGPRLAPGKFSERVRVQHQLIGVGKDNPIAAVVMVPPKEVRQIEAYLDDEAEDVRGD